jgi:hypothetical protein
MTLTDWIGFAGVTALLVAYFLNLRKIIKSDSMVYLTMNFAGAGASCLASVFLKYWPFIILEGCWTAVSLAGLVNSYRARVSVQK